MNALPTHRRTSLRTTLARRLGGNLALVAVLLGAWTANVAGATSAEAAAVPGRLVWTGCRTWSRSTTAGPARHRPTPKSPGTPW